MTTPDFRDGRTNHIYSHYAAMPAGPCVGDPVKIRYDNFDELFCVGNVEWHKKPPNQAPGVVVGFRRVPSMTVGWGVTIVLLDGSTVEVSDSYLTLDVERCS